MVARVYLVRHATAEPHRGDDAGRRLSAEGRARFEAHARALLPKLQVTRIAASPFVRARETGELLARLTGAAVEEEPALASGESSGKELLALLRAAPPGTALVGHNPEIAEAVALAAGKELEVRTGAIAAVDVDGGKVSLVWLEAP